MDLARSAIFLKAHKRPPIGQDVRIHLTLPSETVIHLAGVVDRHVEKREQNPRGEGVEVRLHAVPQTAMWLIETALSSATATAARPARSQNASGRFSGDRAGKIGPRTKDITPPTADFAPPTGQLNDSDNVVFGAESGLFTALEAEFNALIKLNPFQILGVGYSAGSAQIDSAFVVLSKQYHPDRYRQFDNEELKELSSEIFIILRDAYDAIRTEAGRLRELESIRRARAKSIATEHPKPPNSALNVQIPANRPPPTGNLDAAFLFDGTDSGAADSADSNPTVSQPLSSIPLFDPSSGINDGTDIERAYYLLKKQNFDDAILLFEVELRKHPGQTAAKLGIELAKGLRAYAANQRMDAAQHLEAVLEIDPENEEATRALGEIRRQVTSERKSLLAKLLGKKV